ncbi:MAG TPA: hypothetical protein VHS53_06855 [Mucilaginibacter sp.]|jgi:hypothetical protein|nr:hypothetical protein [Mucilaginibacter sp.]
MKNKKLEINEKMLQVHLIEKNDGETGCCTITYQGNTSSKDNFTREECEGLAGQYPGSIWDFNPGKCEN